MTAGSGNAVIAQDFREFRWRFSVKRINLNILVADFCKLPDSASNILLKLIAQGVELEADGFPEGLGKQRLG